MKKKISIYFSSLTYVVLYLDFIAFKQWSKSISALVPLEEGHATSLKEELGEKNFPLLSTILALEEVTEVFITPSSIRISFKRMYDARSEREKEAALTSLIIPIFERYFEKNFLEFETIKKFATRPFEEREMARQGTLLEVD